MGLFGRKKDRAKATQSNGSNGGTGTLVAKESAPQQTSLNQTKKTPPAQVASQKQKATSGKTTANSKEPTLAMVTELIQDLATAEQTSGDRPASALRSLFALSEHSSDGQNRVQMVRIDGAKLVPVLLAFLQRCARGSSEQYLALLVLNNVSIPSENKRLIALDCDAARVFSNLLCEDPSCHLMAIILVNLTFADAELRRELVAPNKNIRIVESLAYALRVSSLTHEEYESRQPQLVDNGDTKSAGALLSGLMDEDRRLRLALSDLDHNSSNNVRGKGLLLDPARLQYPETARWCLSAIKNLTRPGKESPAASVLIETGIVPLIMKIVTVGEHTDIQSQWPAIESIENQSSHATSGDSLLAPGAGAGASPDDGTRDAFNNSPTNWDSNSMQDAALFVAMNLSASDVSREYVREINAVHLLTLIAEYRQHSPTQLTFDDSKQLDFQSLKARMALAYLVGSEGHFGQPRTKIGSTAFPSPIDSVIILSENEIFLMLELLSNTLSQRAKEGPGGYSAATFNVKWVLFAIRCLLTHTLNQMKFINAGGARLNALLLKALALHSLKNSSSIDADAAECAAFSLYLQSSHGFTTKFLPAAYGNNENVAGKGSLIAKVLSAYIRMETTTPPGRHAAEQLLLRLRCLHMSGSLSDLVATGANIQPAEEYGFDQDLMKAAETILVEKRNGARPIGDIFDRPILRSRAPKKGMNFAPWDNRSSIRIYPSALLAVQHLSFGSTKVRHMDAIDDIAIANNIANSANGQKTESYNYWWSWQDSADEIQKNLEHERSLESSSIFSANMGITRNSGIRDNPMALFGFDCGSLCATNTTNEI